MSILSTILNIAPCALESLSSVIVDVYTLKLNLKHRGQILKVFHDNNLFLFTLTVIQQRYMLEASTQKVHHSKCDFSTCYPKDLKNGQSDMPPHNVATSLRAQSSYNH